MAKNDDPNYPCMLNLLKRQCKYMLYTGIKNRKIIYIRSQIIILARLLDFGTIPTMWYFSFFILLHVNVIISVLIFQGRELCSQLYVK